MLLRRRCIGVFYKRYRDQYPWMPTRVIKGSYRDAARRAKSFRELLKKGRAYIGKPEVRRVKIVYSDDQDWGSRMSIMSIMLRTHRGWIELRYKGNRQLHRYLYSGWNLSSELKLECDGGLIAHLAFSRSFEITYDPRNVVSLDVNENNVTIAVFRGGMLVEAIGVETGLGRIVIAYSVRRERISRRRSIVERGVKRKLMKLREGDRKQDILYKVASIIEELARENKAIVIGDIDGDDKERMERVKGRRLRHRIHRWSVAKLIKLLEDRPIHVVRVSERGSSGVGPFTKKRIDGYSHLVIRTAVRGNNGRYKVMKIVLRIAYVDGRVFERDVVGAINIELKYLSSGGRPVAFGSTGTHVVWVKPMNPHWGAAR
jgi:IS605 OrfB family transposase